MGSADFISNENLTKLATAAAAEFIDNSPTTFDSVRRELQKANPDLSDDDAMDQAVAMMSAAHSVATFASGDAPVRQDWNEVIEAMGFDPEKDELTFNEANTRATMDDAIGKGKGKAKASGTAVPSSLATKVIKEAFTYVAHQPVGM